jgi:cytochrome c peroxidase
MRYSTRVRLAFSFLILAFVPALPAATNEELLKDALEFLGPPLPARAPLPADNPFSDEKAALGHVLFNDPRLADDGAKACSGCHDLARGGADSAPAVVGHSWQRLPRNVPSVLNALFNDVVPTDPPGGSRTAPLKRHIRAGLDLDVPRPLVLKRLQDDPEIARRFAAVFPGADHPVSLLNVAKALEAYLATLVTPAPFDAFLGGDIDAIGPIEKIGLASFIDKGCVACHIGTNLGGASYEIFPIGGPQTDKQMAVRVRPLRNVALTGPYGYDGGVEQLEGAVAVMLHMHQSEAMHDGDVKTITAFLKTLTGRLPASR